MRLRGAVVAITGASSGIGAATALAFARHHARLALGARRLARLEAVAARCRQAGAPHVSVHALDVAQKMEADSFITAVVSEHGRLDVLVNNAGVGWAGRLESMPEAKIEQLVGTNLKGVVYTVQAALPWMLEQRSGVIINVASVAGFRASPYSAVYSATKHAVVGLSHALRGELSGTGVKVCVVYPGVTGGTEFFREAGKALGPQYPASWVANLIFRTARRPRRDAMVAPLRLAHLAEPVLGGMLDHALGEIRRRNLVDSGEGAQPEL